MEWDLKAYKWFSRIGVIALCGVFVFGLSAAVRHLGRLQPDPSLDVDTVSADWNDAVRRLNIEPIYPPQEDIYVGDVFATITRADRNFQGRSIKLWHVDVSGAIARAYRDVPTFPKTRTPPATPGAAWEQEFSDTLFEAGGRKALSLVAFPRFSVRRSRQALGTADAPEGLWGWLSASFGFGQSSDEVEELHFPGAETYGINAIEASAALALFCDSGRNKSICSETGVRQMLSMLVGDEIWKKETDRDGRPTGRYAMGVELMLINQAFMTRSIVRTHTVQNGRVVAARIAAKLKEIEEEPPAPASSSAPSGTGVSADALQKQLFEQAKQAADQQKRIVELRASLQAAAKQTGSTLLASESEGTSIGLNQVFPRPVVVGVRAVRMIPVPNGSEP